jgi:hypothetical protein
MEESRARVFLKASLEDDQMLGLTELFLRLRASLIKAQLELGYADEINSISAVAMCGKHDWKESETAVGLGFPSWIPNEYQDSIVLDEASLSCFRLGQPMNSRFCALTALQFFL